MLKRFHEILGAITRLCLYALLIFTPLAVGSAPTWAMMIIHLITLIALTAYLIEKILSWEWHWINTPIDIPIALLLIVALLSALFSTDRYTSVWSLGLLINYIAVFYLIIHSITTRKQLRLLLQTIVYVAVFLSIFGLIKKSGANPFPWWEYDISLNPEIANVVFDLRQPQSLCRISRNGSSGLLRHVLYWAKRIPKDSHRHIHYFDSVGALIRAFQGRVDERIFRHGLHGRHPIIRLKKSHFFEKISLGDGRWPLDYRPGFSVQHSCRRGGPHTQRNLGGREPAIEDFGMASDGQNDRGLSHTRFGSGNLCHHFHPVPAPGDPRPLFHGPQRLSSFHLRNRPAGFSHHGLAGDHLLSIWIEKTGASKPFGEGLYPWSFVGNIRHLVLQHLRFQPPHPGQRHPVHNPGCRCRITSTGKRKAHGAQRRGHGRNAEGMAQRAERIAHSA